MHYFPGGSLRLRCDEESEIIGIDDAEMGEFAYDYVSLEAEIGHHHDDLEKRVDSSNSSNSKQLSMPPHVHVKELASEESGSVHEEKGREVVAVESTSPV